MGEKNEVVLITGATKGLGRSCAQFLANKGFKVYGTGRSVHFGDVLDNFQLIPCDVQDQASVDAAITYLIEKEGAIDIVINNAGRGMLGAAEDASIEESKQLFDLNFHGVQRICQAVLPHMRACQKGKIINISSLAGLIGLPYRSLYAASKYALEGWTESMRMEVKIFNIHVSLVAPGDFQSNISHSRIISEKSKTSAYSNSYKKVAQKIDADVDHGSNPMVIVQAIYKAVKSKKPRLRYIAASPIQRLGVHLHYLLPSSWFEKMIMKSSGMP